MRVVKIEGGYAFKKDIQDAYFYPNEMGNFQVKTRLKRLSVLQYILHTKFLIS